MSQVSAVLRRAERGFWHWCPGCKFMHPLPDGWTFDGNLDAPTFTPSFKHTWPPTGKICHYFLTAGQLQFCTDSTHALAGQTVALPVLPAE